MRKLRDAVKAKASAVVSKTREVVAKAASWLSKNRVTAPVVKAARVVVNAVTAVVVVVVSLVVGLVVLVLAAVLIALDAVVTLIHKIVTLVYITASALLGLVRDRKHFRDELAHGRVVLTHWSVGSYLEANEVLMADKPPVVHAVKVRRKNKRLIIDGGPEALPA